MQYLAVGFKATGILVVLAVFSGCFPHEAGEKLSHFDSQAPAVGELAPRFTLRDLGGKLVKLEDMLGEQPIVLQLGSHSCPVYRLRRFGMAKLHQEYKDRVKFLLVYTLEAHPVGSKSPYADGEWLTSWNKITDVRIPQPDDITTRSSQASESHKTLNIAYPMVVDGMDNSVWKTYGAAASPAFVIDRSGRIVLKQPWVDPKEIRRVLNELLMK